MAQHQLVLLSKIQDKIDNKNSIHRNLLSEKYWVTFKLQIDTTQYISPTGTYCRSHTKKCYKQEGAELCQT